jgi:hypothetical protein
VLLGVAGAGAVVGTIFGVKALQDKKDFTDGEKTNDKADSVERNALIADMAFGAAVTLGVTGAVLLLSNGGSDKSASEAPQRTTAKKGPLPTIGKNSDVRLAPMVGMHGGGVQAILKF